MMKIKNHSAMRKLIEWDKLGYEIVGTGNDLACWCSRIGAIDSKLLITDSDARLRWASSQSPSQKNRLRCTVL